MDSSAPSPRFSSLRVVIDMNGRPFISHNDPRQTAFFPVSEQKPAEIRPTSIEVAWPVSAGLGVRVLSRVTLFGFQVCPKIAKLCPFWSQ
ncbi:hypothetical protein AVEN_44825-1 [Araneus ventricosus]|uniref:Uncharacterized protein n=1 Tax=Araneus ventricosus TaxID=182803 RepID=A0A4Y2CN08_ARAVE|nr:hypothetical protein AVEN_44825-1 [Araneus ventricosus]